MGKLSMELYLENMAKRYKSADKSQKSRILDELCTTGGLHRKHAIRLLNKKKKRLSRKNLKHKDHRGRPLKYSPERYLKPLKEIWLSTDQLCGKRLKMAMPLWLPHYEKSYEALDSEIYQGLLSMSAATIDRLLAASKVKNKRGLSGTKPGKILKKHIPVKTEQWDESTPGFLEADTVAHCGSSLSGSFVWSLTLTDIHSAWTEIRAVWNKGAAGVLSQIKDVETCLPFPILGFDCDNGSEFLNWHLMRYFSNDEGGNRVQFTRSRPYHSDDNAHVEQKNWTHVRQLFGYERFGNPKLVDLMNDLYMNEVSLMNNYFLPNTKLKEKNRVNAKVIKKHDKPATPYQRLMQTEHVSEEKKKELTETYKSLDPFALKKEINRKLNRIFSLVNKTSAQNMCYK